MSLKKYPESGDILRSSLPTLPLSLSSGKFEHPFVKHPSMNPSWNGRVLIVAEPHCFWSSVSSASVGDSLYSEAARLLDGSEQLVVQLVVALIGRNVNPVEAGVGFGQVVCAGVNLVNGEESGASSTLESLKTLEGDPGGTGDKLQQPGSAFLIERLHSFPEPFNDVAVWSAVLESCVGLPVVDVDFTQAAHNQL